MAHNILEVLKKSFSSEKLQLPEKLLDEDRWVDIALVSIEVRPVLTSVNCSLPYPIASDISLQEYNTFFESKKISGYKLEYKKGTVYIVDLTLTEHGAVVELIGNYFRAISFNVDAGLNNLDTFNALNAFNAPIQVFGHPSKENLFQFTFVIFF